MKTQRYEAFRREISRDAQQILRTISLLSKPYSTSYLIYLLRGDLSRGLKSPDHEHISTFGELASNPPDFVRRLIFLLRDRGFIHDIQGRWSLLAQGEIFIETPSELWVDKGALSFKPYEIKLYELLRQLRKKLAKERGVPPYLIFPDHTLDELVQRMPREKELEGISGLGAHRIQQYGPAILQVLNQARKEKARYRYHMLKRRTEWPSYQEIKALFMAGNEPREIALIRGIKEESVRKILFDLHMAEEIDLGPWVEDRLSPSVLEEGTHFFLSHPNASLKDAFNVLGIDYQNLRLCRLYISKTLSWEEELLIT